MSQSELRATVEGARARVIDFCQRLLRSPSPSGHEEGVAALVTSELRALGCGEVRVDEVGNVIARLRGGTGRSVMLHSHMDIVSPGDTSLWSHAPYAGDVAEGCIWGRGACDDKGSLAAQVYALGLLCEAGLVPPGDVYLAAAVGEEASGFGTVHLLRSLVPNLAIVGEPSANTLRRGHRGRFEFMVSFRGRSAHASAPGRAANPLYALARFLLALREAPMVCDATFGGSTVAPTLLYVDQTSSNVIPATVTVHLDWRNAPEETLQAARQLVQRVVDASLDPGVKGTVTMRETPARTYTGLEQHLKQVINSFCLEKDDGDVLLAHSLLEGALSHAVEVDVWAFATDGGHLSAAGTKCLGFGPGAEAMAHVADERLEVEQLLEATAGYMALAMGMGRRD